MVDKQEKNTLVVDVSISSDSNMRKEDQEKLYKYQGLKEMERM